MQIVITPINSPSKNNHKYYLWRTHNLPGPALDTSLTKTQNSFQKLDNETGSKGSDNAPTSTKQNCLTGWEGLQYQKARILGVYMQTEGTKGTRVRLLPTGIKVKNRAHLKISIQILYSNDYQERTGNKGMGSDKQSIVWKGIFTIKLFYICIYAGKDWRQKEKWATEDEMVR